MNVLAIAGLKRWLVRLWPLLGAIVVIAMAYFEGHNQGQAQVQLACVTEKQKIIAEAILKAEENARQHQQIADRFHNQQAEAEAQIQIIEKEVIRYVDKQRETDHCNLDADGVQLINQLINAANRDPSTD